MKAPINADTQYHDLIEEALISAIKGESFEPRMAQIEAFFKANTSEDSGFGYMLIEPSDIGLTIGQIAEHVNTRGSDNFVDVMFRQPFTLLDAEQRQDLAGMGDEIISGAVKLLVRSMEFGYGDPNLIEGQDVAQIERTQVRRSGPR